MPVHYQRPDHRQVALALRSAGLKPQDAADFALGLTAVANVVMTLGEFDAWYNESPVKTFKKAYKATKKALKTGVKYAKKVTDLPGAAVATALNVTLDPAMRRIGLPPLSPLAKAMLSFSPSAPGNMMRWTIDLIAALAAKLPGISKKTSLKIANLIKALTVDLAEGFIRNNVLWMLDSIMGTVKAIFDAAKAPGGVLGKSTTLLKGLMTVLSFSILTSPAFFTVLEQFVKVIGSAKDANALRGQMKKIAEKDPGFGFNVVIFVIGFIYGGEARLAANPLGFAAEVLSLVRIAVREIVREVLKLSGKAVSIFDTIYGLIILALSRVMNLSEGLKSIGLPAKEAAKLASDLMGALRSFNLGAVPKLMTDIVGRVVKLANGDLDKAVALAKKATQTTDLKTPAAVTKAVASSPSQATLLAMKQNWPRLAAVARKDRSGVIATLRKYGFQEDAANVVVSLWALNVGVSA